MTPGKINSISNSINVDTPTSSSEISIQKDDSQISAEAVDTKKIVSTCDISSTTDKNENGNGTGSGTKAKLLECTKAEAIKSELLGSLTSMSSPAVRTSARVIQKMKMDQIRPTTPPPHDKRDGTKDDHHRPTQKTPTATRASRTNWSTVERNLFFDALNEFGKDFEAIANYINSKQKRKNSSDPTFKAKEHVRLIYVQNFQKIAKYLRFSEEIPKKVQELYALINYGEMRKKIPTDNQKFYMKLRELVYRGSVTWRSKGKNCRIKTPSCPALRKINQVEKWQEDIKLPLKVDVEIKPADNESWYIVQSLAQNPRIKTSSPLQKRLISLIKTLQLKWRSREAKMLDQKMFSTISKKEQASPQHVLSPAVTSTATPVFPSCSSAPDNIGTDIPQSKIQSNTVPYLEPVLCITPPIDTTIHRPYVNLNDFLNSYNICLNSYEDRIEAKVRSESLCAEHITNVKETIKSNTKRQRHDSGSDKKSPDMKRVKSIENEKFDHDVMKKAASSTSQDGMSTTSTEDLVGMHDDRDRDFMSPTNENAVFDIDGVNQIPESLSADEGERDEVMKIRIENQIDEIHSAIDSRKEHIDQKNLTLNKVASKKNENKAQLNLNKKRTELKANNRDSFRPLINEETIQKIRQGWTAQNVGDITVGDLYIMFGQDSKLRLEYKWIAPASQTELKCEGLKTTLKSENLSNDSKEILDEYIKSENIPIATVSTSDDVMETKPSLVDVKPKNLLSNKLKQLLMLAGMMEKTKRKTTCACGHFCDRGMNKIKKDEVSPRSFISNKTYPTTHTEGSQFRQPMLPTRTGHPQHFEPYRINMNTSRSKQSRWIKSRSNRVSKQVVVQRLLPLQPGITQPYNVLTTTDVNYSGSAMETPLIKPITSGLTRENLDRMNNLSNNIETIQNASFEYGSSHTDGRSSCENKIEEPTNGNGVEMKNCDIVDAGESELLLTPTSEAHDHLDSDEEENNRMRQKFDEDPGIQSLMEISLPSPIPMINVTDDYFNDPNSQPPVSPMGILRESPVPGATKWFEENMNDFSLSSFLGHLEANCDPNSSRRSSSRSPNRRVESSSLSTISETSIDYITRFEELAESMKNDTNNIIMP